MKVAILGIGRIGSHLSYALQKHGHTVVEIRTHNPLLAAEEASSCNLLLLCVRDENLITLNTNLRVNIPIAHVSGSTEIAAISSISSCFGAFYPIQTFSKDDVIDFSSVPICIEGSDQKIENLLLEMASTLSSSVQKVTFDQRKLIHLAAVFACNYSNLMYLMAEHILKQGDMSLDLLHPLIEQTAEKIKKISPTLAQTGPAVRKDYETLNNHSSILKSMPNGDDFSLLYNNLADFLIQYYGKL